MVRQVTMVLHVTIQATATAVRPCIGVNKNQPLFLSHSAIESYNVWA